MLPPRHRTLPGKAAPEARQGRAAAARQRCSRSLDEMNEQHHAYDCPFPESWGVLHSDRLMHPVEVADWPVRLDASRQLFLDDHVIADRQGLRRRLHQPKKHPANPVLWGETPWEGHSPVLAYVLRDQSSGRFRA